VTLQKCFSHLSLVIYFRPYYLATSSNSRWSGAPYVTLEKYFWHESLVIYFFPNLTHKTKTGTSNRWGTTSSSPSGRIIMIGESETGSSSQIIFITLFSGRSLGFAWPHTSLNILWRMQGQNLLSPELKLLACFDFSSSNLNFQSRMLGTAGAAPRPPRMLNLIHVWKK